MSSTYAATFNVQTDDVEAAHASTVQTVGAHCIVERSTWNPTMTRGLYVLSVTYVAAGDAEARQIMADAMRATGQPTDTLRVTTRAGNYRREVTPA